MPYRNPEDGKAYQKRYWILNKAIKKEKSSQYWLKSKYGMTVENYNDLLVQQDFKCALCFKHISDNKKRLAVDHCHETGRIRGLLCMHCNAALGQMGDNKASIERVLKYVTNETQNASI